MDCRKGGDLLLAALRCLPEVLRQSVLAVVFGNENKVTGYPCAVTALGRLHDPVALRLAYAAADVFVCPSRQESFSNTTLEALACGTPVVGFSVGGIPDMIEHGATGMLVTPYDVQELAQAMTFILSHAEARRAMGLAAREAVLQRYAMPVVSGQYAALYEDILEQAARGRGL